MPAPVLATKLFMPPPRPHSVLRPRLIERLNEGRGRGRALTLVSAPAGFGKSTLLSAWIDQCARLDPKLRVAWLSLDEGDNEPSRFLLYLAAALHGAEPSCGADAMAALQSPQPPSAESVLTDLINEIDGITGDILLVLDDYHAVHSPEVDKALAFLLEYLPEHMRLVITTREDPNLPLARLRARSELTELRAVDLRFSLDEAADFLGRVMCLKLTAEDIAALENRTEGWIAGLQLAALSMRGQKDIAGFIRSFTGSHRFVMDYLVEEVLQRQPESVQTFLLRTSILDRLCGPLCDYVFLDPSASGQEILENLERANLFIVPLDNERRWYRYHHLFADLLRQRLHESAASSAGDAGKSMAELHGRASRWYEDNGLNFEAFHHAAAANDIVRAERLLEGKGMPQHRGATTAVLNWLASLPKTVLDARPSLCVRYATLSLVAGQTTGVEEKLQAAEAALHGAEPDDKTRDLIGQIAAARATLALTRYQPEAMITHARRALEYLHQDNLLSRARAIWTLGFAYQVQGDRAGARQAFTEAIAVSQASGNTRFTVVATISLGAIQELENNLYQAAETFRSGLQLAGDHPQPFENEAHLGLARILYEWNDLEAAERHAQQSLHLARQFDSVIDRYVICEVFLARLKLARGDVAGAAAMLAETERSARQNNFLHRRPEIAAAQVLVLIRQGNLPAAAQLAHQYELPFSQARVLLAQGDASAALRVLQPLRQQMEAKGWQDERLKVMVFQAVAHHAQGQEDKAVQLLGDALVLAEPGGFIRVFVDEGTPLCGLLSKTAARKIMPDYAARLLAAFETKPSLPSAQPLIEPLSQRELEVLKLIADGLSNQEIGERLFLALDTIKGHNRRIFDKLEVKRRTEAIARGRELGLV
jgi:LuxR family maltose regulon positive regulatory protein